METYYLTFGQTHVHRYNNLTLDCDSVIAIEADSREVARIKAFELFGTKWSGLYNEEDYSPKYYPRGVLATVKT